MKFTKKLALGVTVMMAVVAVGCGGGGEKKAAVKYPTKPINLIVPYAAGGSSDLSARPFANELHNILAVVLALPKSRQPNTVIHC